MAKVKRLVMLFIRFCFCQCVRRIAMPLFFLCLMGAVGALSVLLIGMYCSLVNFSLFLKSRPSRR